MFKPKVALVHSGLVLGGGPEAITLNTIEALKDFCDLFLITYEDVDLKMFNSFYGTNVRPEDISIIKVAKPYFKKASVLRRYKLTRYCQRISSNFNVMFSIYNTMDFNTRGIQYIIDPSYSSRLLWMLNPSTKNRWFYKDSIIRRIYIKIGDFISNSSIDGIKRNKSIADSNWTGELAKKHLGIDCQTIYPPVLDNENRLVWEERENGFVCLGRMSPDKNIEKIVTILKRLKNQFSDIHLHIIGKDFDNVYKKQLEDFLGNERDWVFIERNVASARKNELLSMHKYGIHGKDHEPFGISVAEIVKSGCIVWVPEGGGQVEIVNHANLVYSSIEDARDKINNVIHNLNLQKDLLDHLSNQAQIFSVNKFRSQIKELLLDFLN